MSSNIKKILIIGGTSGIGEAFVERFHARGKKVITTGRRSDRLSTLAKSHPGLETITWDITDLSSIPSTVQSVLKAHPDLDTVFINAGIMRHSNFLAPTSTDESVSEISTNFTAVVLLTRAFMPHLVELARAKRHAALVATSSGLAFTPAPLFPVYCATKAAVHSFLVSIREQIAAHEDTNVYKHLSVCEVIPPMVGTDLLDMESSVKPMPLDEYISDALGKLDAGEEGGSGKLTREVGTGSAEMRLNAWRGAIGPILEKFGFKE